MFDDCIQFVEYVLVFKSLSVFSLRLPKNKSLNSLLGLHRQNIHHNPKIQHCYWYGKYTWESGNGRKVGQSGPKKTRPGPFLINHFSACRSRDLQILRTWISGSKILLVGHRIASIILLTVTPSLQV